MASARNEAPRAPCCVGCDKRVFPSPPGVGSGEVAMPLPRMFFSIFEIKMANFGAFWELILLQ